MTKFMGSVPIFAVSDMTESKAFYVENLGFEIDFVYGDPEFYAGLIKDDLELHLIADSSPNAKQPAGNGYLSILTDEVDDLCQKLIAADIEILVPPGDRDYGLRDFNIEDPDGNVLIFSTPVKS